MELTGKGGANAVAILAILAALPSCASPSPLQVALRDGEPVYRCVFTYKLGWRDAEYDGYFRAGGSPVGNPLIFDSSLRGYDPLLASMLESHFRALAAEPERNCTKWDHASDTYRQHSFDCGVTERETGNQRFSAEDGYVRWSLAEDGVVVMRLGWNMRFNEGFPWGASSGPALTVERPADFGDFNSRTYTENGKQLLGDNYHETGEVRAGDVVYRDWSLANAALSVPWNVWPQMHGARSDIVVTIHDAQLDKTRSWVLPSDFPRGIEPVLKQVLAEQDERERDPVNRCEPTEGEMGPPIIVY